MEPLTFAQRLVAIRTQRGYTQVALAHLAQVADTQLSLFERGKRLPSARTLVRLANALEVATDYLLCRTDRAIFAYTDGTRLGDVLAACAVLNAEQLDAVRYMAQAMHKRDAGAPGRRSGGGE